MFESAVARQLQNCERHLRHDKETSGGQSFLNAAPSGEIVAAMPAQCPHAPVQSLRKCHTPDKIGGDNFDMPVSRTYLAVTDNSHIVRNSRNRSKLVRTILKRGRRRP